MNDGTGLAEALLGLDGFRVLEVSETPCEVVITAETTAEFVGCGSCGVRAVRARAQGGASAGPGLLRSSCPAGVAQAPVALHRSALRSQDLDRGRSEHVDAQVVLTRRAGAEACRQVGELARPVAIVAPSSACAGGR